MKRILVITIVTILLLTGCYRGEPMPPTPDMDFLREFFTVNKDGRMDIYLDALVKGEDPQAAKDSYHAELEPYIDESALVEIKEANYLYIFDKACTNYSDEWTWRRLGQIEIPRAGTLSHNKFEAVLQYAGIGKYITVTGHYDMDEDRKILSFSLDLDTLPGDISSIEDMSSSFSQQEYDAYVDEMKTQYLNTVDGGVSEGVVSYSQGYPILNCGDPYKRTYFLFIDGVCKGQLTVSYVKGECVSSFIYKDMPEVTALYEDNTAFNLVTTGQSLYAYYEGGSTLVQGEIEQTMAEQVLFQELVETHPDELQAIRLE